MKIYRIKDWDKNFELNRTRELKKMTWLPIPNQHDGDGYTELMAHEDGVLHFGVWVLLLQVASKCDPRGTLVRDCRTNVRDAQKPHDFDSISRITRCPKKFIEEAVPRLIHIGWLEELTNNIADKCDEVASSCDALFSSPIISSPNNYTPDFNSYDICKDDDDKILMGFFLKLFNRRETTKWSKTMIQRFKEIEWSSEDLELIQWLWDIKHPYKIKDLDTLLNNFQKEVEKARAYKQEKNYGIPSR